MNWRSKILIIALLFGPVTAWSEDFGSLLSCLGREELGLHKKHQHGPIYSLNQTLVNHIASIGETHLKPHFKKKVCSSKSLPTSVRLIEVLLLEGMQSFDLEQKEGETEHFLKMRLGNYETLLSELPHIFYSYLASLQALTPYPYCLKEKIPELNYFTKRLRYLEEEIPMERLIDDKEKLKKVFRGLRRYNDILVECSLLQKELEKKRSRKSNP